MPIGEERAIRALLDALPPGAALLAAREQNSHAVVSYRDVQVPVRLRWAGAGFPRDVRQALHDITTEPNDVATVVAAKSVSRGAQELLSERDIGWVTEDGAASLSLGPIWVERRATSTTGVRDDAVRWNASTSDIAEAVLSAVVEADLHRAVPGIAELTARSGRASGSVSQTLTAFDSQGWTAKGREAARNRRTLIDATGMLDSWSESLGALQGTELYTFERNPDRIAAEIRSVSASAVFSGEFAEQRLAATATSLAQVIAYLPANAFPDALTRLIAHDFEEASEGAGRLIIRPMRAPAFHGTMLIDGFRLASPIRVYAELRAQEVRGRELADAFRHREIGF
ncbi:MULTISPECIES: hypothetical protein [unclassified Microbacterium]|uniref:hypothetical protein n=1 Tax=unclassified Microbacterium TaxID=2609290 RepID=UPI00097EDB96|nr:hypothetical protein [Microbacterium sp. JB110]RCS60010.1 hypothetical protein CIK77_11410 [Microbacterium sp. JB110]SJM45008.1 hypothetical protein CZ774_01735 [Frigoribacterium sp. JB110]